MLISIFKRLYFLFTNAYKRDVVIDCIRNIQKYKDIVSEDTILFNA